MISCLFFLVCVAASEKGTILLEELTTFKQILHGGGCQMGSKDMAFIQLF